MLYEDKCKIPRNEERIKKKRKAFYDKNPRPTNRRNNNRSNQNSKPDGTVTFAGITIVKRDKKGKLVANQKGMNELRVAVAKSAAAEVVTQLSNAPAPAPAPAPSSKATEINLEALRAAALRTKLSKDK